MTVLIFYFDRKDEAYEKKIFMLDFVVGCDGAENVTTESVSANETESVYESNTNKKDETENDGTTETDGGIGCELPTEADPFEGLEGEVTPEFVKAQMSFATRLFKESMAQRDKKENLLISPLSVLTALLLLPPPFLQLLLSQFLHRFQF